MDILKTLVQIRKEKKIKQKAVGKHLGVTDDTMSRYESGQRKISLPLLFKYADYLGYEIRLLKK